MSAPLVLPAGCRLTVRAAGQEAMIAITPPGEDDPDRLLAPGRCTAVFTVEPGASLDRVGRTLATDMLTHGEGVLIVFEGPDCLAQAIHFRATQLRLAEAAP